MWLDSFEYPFNQAPEQGFFLFWRIVFWRIDCGNGRDIVKDVSSIMYSHCAEGFQVVEKHLLLMLLGAFNPRPCDKQVAFCPTQPVHEVEVAEPLLVWFGPVVLREVLSDFEVVVFELVELSEWVIGADAQLEKFLVHLDSFPVCFVEEPVGELDDWILQIFVVA